MQYNQISLPVFSERLRVAMNDRINAFVRKTLKDIKNKKYETLMSAKDWAQLYKNWSLRDSNEIEIEIMKYLSK